MGWASFRDKVTGTVAPVVNTFTGGLLGTLGGAGGSMGAGGLMGLLGGMGGLFGGQGGMQGGFSGFGGNFGTQDSGQYGNLMDMLGQRYQQGNVSPTGNANLNSQGLI